MNINSILNKIYQYKRNEIGEKLNYNVIKSKNDFLKNYEKHDIASKYILDILNSNGYKIEPLGKDLRYSKVIMRNEMPDFLAFKKNTIFAFDIKAKSRLEYFGWINKRAISGYKKFRNTIGIDVYIIFILLSSTSIITQTAFTTLDSRIIKEETSWDKNKVLIYEWKNGLPF